MSDDEDVDVLYEEAAAEMAANELEEAREIEALIEEGSLALEALALEALQRHLQTFAASGIVDLSEREIGHRVRHELDFLVLGDAAASISALDLSSTSIEALPSHLLRPLTSLQVLCMQSTRLSRCQPYTHAHEIVGSIAPAQLHRGVSCRHLRAAESGNKFPLPYGLCTRVIVDTPAPPLLAVLCSLFSAPCSLLPVLCSVLHAPRNLLPTLCTLLASFENTC